MGIAVIVLGILSIAATSYAVIVFQPAIHNLALENPSICSVYDEATEKCLSFNGDLDPNLLQMVLNLYNASLMIPIVVGVGVIALWGWLAISRKDFDG